MKTLVEHIRLPKQSRDQLITLKRNTGIQNWNVLCRWAFCISMAEKSAPPLNRVAAGQGVEMTWAVFAGEMSDVLLCLLKARCRADGIKLDETSCNAYLRSHIQRGLCYLTADKRIQNVGALVGLAAIQA